MSDHDARIARILNVRAQDLASGLNRTLAEALDEGLEISVAICSSGRSRSVAVEITAASEFQKELRRGR